MELLKQIDVLVDGPFILDKKSYDCVFRGSTNQRIIDPKESLKKKKVCLVEKYYPKDKKKNNKRERMYI
ncbi:MAG: 4Fe-4S cluster-binding domain-containing protein [Bacilli bacterium]